ncbi:hypothetical protein O181_117699, partial [Austropuccinia psidii MF-1]|nr:hypothetical protein [Austropuccinia psidii MF-1]
LVEENFIPLETQSQGSTPVIPAELESSKGKGKRHSESLITERNWTLIATQRSRKPRKSASIKGKPTLITCTWKITIINPVVTSKGKFPKEVDKEFEKVQSKVNTLRKLGHLGYSGRWQDTEGNHTHSAIYLPIPHKPKPRGLEGYGSSSSASPTPQRYIPIDHGQQEVQPSITLGRTWSKFPEDMSQRDILQRPYSNHQRMESHQEVQTPGKRETRIRKNQATIQDIEEQLKQTSPTLISSGSQGVDQPTS